MAIEVTLTRHTGQQQTAIGMMTVDVGQCRAWASVDGGPRIPIGYLPDGEEAKFLPICQFVELPESVQSQVLAALNATVGREVDCGIKPLSRAQVAALVESQIDEPEMDLEEVDD